MKGNSVMTDPRILDISDGVAMVVTDLHGDGTAFDRVRDRFLDLHADDHADRLIICGDLIHGYGSAEADASLRMLSEMRQLQQAMGRETVVLLMGNHEFPHVYNITLSKGNLEFTSRFERALSDSGKRAELTAFLMSLPIYVRTKAGVTISHAGATPVVQSADDVEHIAEVDHAALLKLADDKLRSHYDLEALKQDKRYHQQAMHYLAVDSVNDPRYPHLLRGQYISEFEDEFAFLWRVLFARNEQAHGYDGYAHVAKRFLKALSETGEHEQRVVVAGHIGTQGGHDVVTDNHLRLATYAHAHPNEAGQYLLLDCADPVNSAPDLLPHLRPLFP
jgi:hypothetical protein